LNDIDLIEERLMDDETGEQERRGVLAALTNAIEGLDAEISPQLARAVAATVRVKKEITRDFGFFSHSEVRRALDLQAEDELPDLFWIPYRKQRLLPGFQFEAVGDGAAQRVRPVIARMKDLARERGWSDEDVVFTLVCPTTYLGDDRSFAAHMVSGHDPELLFRTFEEKMSVDW
jgi:hypothetical protein